MARFKRQNDDISGLTIDLCRDRPMLRADGQLMHVGASKIVNAAFGIPRAVSNATWAIVAF